MNSQIHDLPGVLYTVIQTAIKVAGADFGNIQLLGPDGNLRIVAHHGFPDWWIDYWNNEGRGHGACDAARAQGKPVVVEDV